MKLLNIWQLFGLAFLASLIKALPQSGGRIVGGYEVDIKDIPFQVSLQTLLLNHLCGGTLIAKHYVLTAAHCTNRFSAINPKFYVRLGSSYIAENGLVVKPSYIFQHEQFDAISAQYDYSIVKLEDYDDSLLTFEMQYAQLPWKYDIEDGTIMTASGWGTTSDLSEVSPVLRAVNVPIVNNEACNIAYSGFNSVTDQMLCAGLPEGGKDACKGDSGGPLFSENVIWGVTSWGNGCASPRYPGIYSRVYSVLDWITTIIADDL